MGIIWTSSGEDLGVILGSFGRHLGIIWGSFRVHLGPFGDHLGIIWGSSGTIWGSSGDHLVIFWGAFGSKKRKWWTKRVGIGPNLEILIRVDAPRSRDLENRGFGQQFFIFPSKKRPGPDQIFWTSFFSGPDRTGIDRNNAD